MKNFTEILTENAARAPHAPALIHKGTAYSYSCFDDAVWKLASHLVASGVARGDVICLRFADEFLLAHAYFAVARIGGTAFILPRQASAIQQAAMAQGVGSRICLTDMDGAPRFDITIPLSLEILEGLSTIDRAVMDPAPTGAWLIITGSGSTGQPKLIPKTHTTLTQGIGSYASAIRPAPGDRIASILSLETAPSFTQMMSAILYGAAFCVLDQDGLQLGKWCEANRITVLGVITGHLESLLRVKPEMLSSLRAIVPVGAPVNEAVRHRVLERLGDVLYVMYGATEAGPICVATPADVKSTPGTVGRVLEGVSLEIVSDANVPLPAGQPGNIRVRSLGASAQYLGQDAYSRQTFQDGWVYPGDLGRLTPDGQLIHLGRSDDMMILNGLNIFPAELEAALLNHPAVADAVVRPARHPIFQEIPIAAVRLRDGAAASEAELSTYAKDILGARAPRRIAIVAEVPRNAQGKLDRTALANVLRRDFEIDMP